MAALTNKEHVRLMCTSILNKLENGKSVEFPARLRQVISDELYQLIGTSILTEEDLRERTLAMLGDRAQELASAGEEVTESAQYRTAKAVVRKNFGDDELNGFFFQKTLKALAQMVSEYLMRSSHIDDVFESDEDLEKITIDAIKKFKVENLH